MARRPKSWPTVIGLLSFFVLAAFLRRPPTAAAAREAGEASQRLAAFESLRRSASDFAASPTWDQMSGPDPYVLAALPGWKGTVGLLRGADAVVLLDAGFAEQARAAAPPSPSALAVADDGSIFVAGELSPIVARFQVVDGALVKTGSFELPGVRAIRGLATGPNGWLYVVEEHRGTLIGLTPPVSAGEVKVTPQFEVRIGNGPIRLERVRDRLIVDCLLDHAIVIQKIDPAGMPHVEPPIRIVHDGPIWSFAARPAAGGLLLVAAGVEDHPLDRTIGAFGYIDSFLYFYRVDFARRNAAREAALNLSELGVVTPKALAFVAGGSVVVVSGYGSDGLAHVPWGTSLTNAPGMSVEPFVPGANAAIELSAGVLAFADPLLDAWVRKAPGQPAVVVPAGAAVVRREPMVRLGEALFFTTAMAPWNSSDGPLSRFTCETCHFEGYVDGRIHHTGRGDVHAVTKPLLGLFNNRPHFSRALDDDLATVAFNEFRVANARSGHDPWFGLSIEQFPWLGELGLGDADLSPELLRRGLMSFLMTFSHRPNPMALGRVNFSEGERRGAALFLDRCELCHQARILSDAPESRVPFEQWERLVLSRPGPIVWAKAEYEKTGIMPYVHESGARVPSLRRLYKKQPYFTNGSARTMDAVLEGARFDADHFWHDEPKDGSTRARLEADERRYLLEFLDLL